MKVKVRATKFSDIVKCTERGRHIRGRGVIQVFLGIWRDVGFGGDEIDCHGGFDGVSTR